MAFKTRRKKQNRSPIRPYPTATAHVVTKGDRVRVKGVRGRTKVKRVTDEAGKRLTSVRITEVVPQIAAKAVGDRKPKTIFLGRAYTGVARSKAYPYRSTKRGAPPAPIKVGLMGRAARAVKRVVVGTGKPGLAALAVR
jgi:hypothetical protein